MKWKLFICGLALFALCSCAQMFAEKTTVELYNPETGTLIGRVYSNKGYDGFECKGTYKKDGTGSFVWKANKVNSDTVAVQALESNKELTKALSGLANTAVGIASPLQ